MQTPILNNPYYNEDLIELIKKVKELHKDFGGYIEHFYYNDETIIVKLTNGFIKISETILEQHKLGIEAVSEAELKKIGNTFLKTLL